MAEEKVGGGRGRKGVMAEEKMCGIVFSRCMCGWGCRGGGVVCACMREGVMAVSRTCAASCSEVGVFCVVACCFGRVCISYK